MRDDLHCEVMRDRFAQAARNYLRRLLILASPYELNTDPCKDHGGSLLAVPEEIPSYLYLTVQLNIDLIPILPWILSGTGVP